LLNEPASTFYACVWLEPGLLKKGSCLARVLGVTKFANDRDMIWSYLVLLLKSDLDVQQTRLCTGKVFGTKINFHQMTAAAEVSLLNI
jgi:hypothetical protein